MKSDVYPVVTDLPRYCLTGIGKVAAAWAVLEHELRHATFAAVGIGPKHGRTAIRTPRAKESIAMIRELISIDGRKVEADLTKLEKLLDKLEPARDLLCHGIWLQTPEGIVLQDLSGSWKPAAGGPTVRRRTHPTALRVSPEHFDQLRDLIRSAAEMIVELRRELRASH